MVETHFAQMLLVLAVLYLEYGVLRKCLDFF